MPKTHHLRTLPVYFDAVRRGDKTFEIRKNDRDFQTGDTLVLEECTPVLHAPRPPGAPTLTREELGYTGNTLEMRVSYCLRGPAFGLEAGHVVMGLGQPEDDAPVNLDLFSEHPMQDADGWIEWGGGECPVPRDVRVEVLYRDGRTIFRIPSGRPAGEYFWQHSGKPIEGHIVAYRIHAASPSERLAIMRSLNAESD